MSETNLQRPPFSFEERFNFLAQSDDKIASLRFALCPPDFFDLNRWSIYDRQERRTVARGATPVEATDNAMYELGFVPSFK